MLFPKPVLPELRAGAKYRLVFRLQGFKKNRSVFFSGTIPNITFRRKCICCDSNICYPLNVNPAVTSHELKEPMETQVCRDCEDHALEFGEKRRWGGYFIGLGIVWTLVFGGKMLDSEFPVQLALLMLIGPVITVFGLIRVSDSSKKAKFKGQVHHSMTKIYFTRNKELIVETSNRRVANELLEDHAQTLSHINTTDHRLDDESVSFFADDQPKYEGAKISYADLVKWFETDINDAAFKAFLQANIPDATVGSTNHISSASTRLQLAFHDKNNAMRFMVMSLYPETASLLSNLPGGILFSDTRAMVYDKMGKPFNIYGPTEHPRTKKVKTIETFDLGEAIMTIDFDIPSEKIIFIQVRHSSIIPLVKK